MRSQAASALAGHAATAHQRLEQAFAARTSGLTRTTRTLLLVAALDDGGDIAQILAAASLLEGRSVTAAELADAAAAQLVSFEADGVRFRHPLIRSAVYQQVPVFERQAAHAALAAVHAADPDRSIWHRAASLAAPDAVVSAELEETAARALRRGAPAVAASALVRAAELSTDVRGRGRLLIRAAETEFGLGRVDLSMRLLRDAQQLELDRHERTRLMFLFEILDQGGWSGAATARSFVETADELIETGDTAGALEALRTVALRCWWGNPDHETRELVVAAAERLPVAQDDPALIATLALSDPVRRGAVVIERIAAAEPAADPTVAFLLGSSATAVWAHDLSIVFLAAAVDGFRAQGRLGLLAQALVSEAWAGVMLANATLAAPAAEEAERLGAETGQPLWAAAAGLARAVVAADRGATATAVELAAQAEKVLLPIGANPMLSLVQFARGRAALVDGSLHGRVRAAAPGLRPGRHRLPPLRPGLGVRGSGRCGDPRRRTRRGGPRVPRGARVDGRSHESSSAPCAGELREGAARSRRGGRAALPGGARDRPRALARAEGADGARVRHLAAPPAPCRRVAVAAARSGRGVRRPRASPCTPSGRSRSSAPPERRRAGAGSTRGTS